MGADSRKCTRSVNPACAGMILPMPAGLPPGPGKPRVCGDDPLMFRRSPDRRW